MYFAVTLEFDQGSLVEDVNAVADEMGENKAIAEVLHAETERFV